MSIEEAELDLESRGLVLIEGKNETNPTFQSNGSGKSSLLSSITYALYGQTPSGLKADDVINRKVGKNTSVKLFFDVDGQSYRVERYRKHPKQKNLVKLFQGNTELTGKSMRDTDKKIQDIFGIDYNTYMNSIVQGQGEAEVFSQATDKGKKEILENITNIAIYKKAQEIAKEKVKETSSELGDIQQDIETTNRDLESTKERQEEERSSYQHTIDSINETKENLDNLLQELEEAKSSYPKDLKRNINRLHKLEAPTYPQIDFTTDDFIKEQEAMITSIENFLTSEVNRVKSEGSSEIQTLKEQKENITTQVQPILTELNVLTNEIDNHKRDIEQLDFAVECPVCGNPLDASHAQKENERLQLLINQKQEKVDFTSNIYTNELVPMLNNMDKQIQEKEQEIANNVKEFEQSAKIQLKGVEQDIAYYKTDKEAEIRQGFEQEQVIYQGKMREKDQLTTDQNRLDNNISGLEQQIKSEKSILKRLEGLPKPKDFTEDIKSFEEELQNLNIELLAKTDKIDKYENVVQLYSNTGVRSVVLDLVTPFLNEQANKYMKTLSGSDIEILFTTQTENKDGSLSDKFDIEINNSSGGDTYQSNSEGEKKRIDLAISFAIQDLVLSKNNMQTNLAIYDECFEGLDEVGSENVIKLLRERLDRLETIFVITHNDHLKTLFEQVVTVQKIDGLSKIIES